MKRGSLVEQRASDKRKKMEIGTSNMDIIPQTHTILYPQESNRRIILCHSLEGEKYTIGVMGKEGFRMVGRVKAANGAWLQIEREVKA